MTDYQDNPSSGVCVVTGLYRETVTTIRHLTHHTQNEPIFSIHNPASLQWLRLMTETACNTRRRDPSPDEIAAACREIRATWSPEETLKRLRADLRPWFRRCDGRREDFSLEVYEEHHAQREKIEV
jgi:hypothetical protein